MREYKTDSVAIVDPRPHIVGGVLLSDIFPVIISRNELPGTVSDYMTRNVTVASPTDTIQKIYTMIMESGFSAFPVVKKKRIVGLISRRDLIRTRRMQSVIASHAHTTIEEVMSKDVVTIGPDETVSSAAELLVKHDVSRLPVVDGDRIVGIVDRHDILTGLRKPVTGDQRYEISDSAKRLYSRTINYKGHRTIRRRLCTRMIVASNKATGS